MKMDVLVVYSGNDKEIKKAKTVMYVQEPVRQLAILTFLLSSTSSLLYTKLCIGLQTNLKAVYNR